MYEQKAPNAKLIDNRKDKNTLAAIQLKQSYAIVKAVAHT